MSIPPESLILSYCRISLTQTNSLILVFLKTDITTTVNYVKLL